MKYIRLFPSASIRDAVLAEIEHGVLSYTEGEGMLLKPVTTPPVPAVDITTPFYIEDISGSENTISIIGSNRGIPLTIEKSTDCKTWETMGSTSGTEISATVPANGKLYLRCSATQWSTNNGMYFNCFNSASGNFNVGGNINSLLYGSSFNGQTEFPSGTGNYTFKYLFAANTHIRSAEELLLPATTLKSYCYDEMFYGCSSLTTAPSILPATTLTRSCYQYMFQNCTSLTTAPVLPATTMAMSCYAGMFSGCTSLTTAPELPATTMTTTCYAEMFSGCTSLNYIKCLATDISAESCLSNWVTNVSSTGTFVKDPSMTSWATSESGIPSGWTVQDAV